MTARLQVPAVGEDRLEVGDDRRLRVDRKAGAAEQVDRARLGGEPGCAVHLVEERPEGAARGDGRVLLPQRAGGGVAWIGEGPQPRRLLAAVQLLEGGDREVDLAPRLEDLRDLARREVELGGNRRHGAHVRGHVLTDPAVATGGAAYEVAPLVGQRDRQAVDLRLADEGRPALGGEEPLQARPPGEDLLERGDLVEAHHGRAVHRRREQRRGGDPDRLGRRVRLDELGMLLLEGEQLVLEGVVLGIGDVRGVLEVVLRVVALDEAPQLGDAGSRARLPRHAVVAHAAMPEPTTSSPT